MSPEFLFHTFPGGQKLELIMGDLTEQKVDAIVNAANEHLMHGGGVAAAIVRRGGEVIQEESDVWVEQHGVVSHEQPAYTHAGQLPCRYVIHAVGPVWGSGDEEKKLRQAIQGSLALAEKLGLASIALPPISTGIFGFPKDKAAIVFMKTFQQFFIDHPKSILNLVRMVIIDQATYLVFGEQFKLNFPAAKQSRSPWNPQEGAPR